MEEQRIQKINEEIKALKSTDKISDGYHTFEELYAHRCLLWINLCNLIKDYPDVDVFVTSGHQDEEDIWDGWFLLCLDCEFGQLSYHLPNEYRNLCSGFKVRPFNNTFDNHSSDDVLIRLIKLVVKFNVIK